MPRKCKADGLTYGEFMRRVDLRLLSLCGLCSRDLSCCVETRRMYEDGDTVDEVATEILTENEFPREEDDCAEA